MDGWKKELKSVCLVSRGGGGGDREGQTAIVLGTAQGPRPAQP